jgi:hypothetical protein
MASSVDSDRLFSSESDLFLGLMLSFFDRLAASEILPNLENTFRILWNCCPLFYFLRPWRRGE